MSRRANHRFNAMADRARGVFTRGNPYQQQRSRDAEAQERTQRLIEAAADARNTRRDVKTVLAQRRVQEQQRQEEARQQERDREAAARLNREGAVAGSRHTIEYFDFPPEPMLSPSRWQAAYDYFNELSRQVLVSGEAWIGPYQRVAPDTRITLGEAISAQPEKKWTGVKVKCQGRAVAQAAERTDNVRDHQREESRKESRKERRGGWVNVEAGSETGMTGYRIGRRGEIPRAVVEAEELTVPTFEIASWPMIRFPFAPTDR